MNRKIYNGTSWLEKTEQLIKNFVNSHKTTYIKSKRQSYALFEIGCFLSLIDLYKKKGFRIQAENIKNGEFKFLTTPSGNPDNFSFIKMTRNDNAFLIRQQIRVESSKDDRIYFSPDIVVLKDGTSILEKKDINYANGGRKFFSVESESIIAIHECKSLEPFPELFASFFGMFMLAHEGSFAKFNTSQNGLHLQPALFIGGKSRGIHINIIKAYEEKFPINIVTDMHSRFNVLKNKKFFNLADEQ